MLFIYSFITVHFYYRKHVVFGRVLSGQEVVVSIENLPVDNRSRPLQQAVIANCGELIMQTSGQVKAKGCLLLLFLFQDFKNGKF